jgi:predicted site-specific integrase-resolvase
MTQTPALLTSADVCDKLGIDRSTLSRWVAGGRIATAYKLPGPRGAFLFDPAEVARVKTELLARVER